MLQAIASRIAIGRTEELEGWATQLRCPRGEPGEELRLASVAFALRFRANGAEPNLAKSLRETADKLDRVLLARRDHLDLALRVARSGLPLENDSNASFSGCARPGLRLQPPEPECTAATFAEDEPAMRYLSAPMVFRLDAN